MKDKQYIESLLNKILGDKQVLKMKLRELFEEMDPMSKITLATTFSSYDNYSLSTFLNSDANITIYRLSNNEDVVKAYADMIGNDDKVIVIPYLSGVVDNLNKFPNNIVETHTKITESYIEELPILSSVSYVDPDNLNICFEYYLDPKREFFKESLRELEDIHIGCGMEKEEVDYYITPYLKVKLLKVLFKDNSQIDLEDSTLS